MDQSAVGWILVSLLGLSALYHLVAKRGRRRGERRECVVETDSIVTTGKQCGSESVNGCGSEVDVVIVGAGVAGAALAYTLGKVISFVFPFLSSFTCGNVVVCLINASVIFPAFLPICSV